METAFADFGIDLVDPFRRFHVAFFLLALAGSDPKLFDKSLSDYHFENTDNRS